MPGIGDPRRESFEWIWHTAIVEREPSLPWNYTTALLVVIMWEESTFCNIRERKDNGEFGPACGFGQVNDTEYWRFKKQFGTSDKVRNRVLADKNFSVRLVSMMLADMHRILKDRDAVLKGYAGVDAPGADQHNVDGYNHWLDAERILLGALADPKNCFVGYWGDTTPLRPFAERALRAAKPNSAGFIPQAVNNMPEIRPEGSAPGWLTGAVRSHRA
jgi:hypothetical protein